MVTSSRNIAFDLRAVVAGTPDAPAIIAPDVTLSFAKLWLLVDCFACRMAEAGIDHSARVGLATGDRIVAIAGIFAAALLGAEFTTVDLFLLRVPGLRPTHFLRSPDMPGLDGVDFQVIDATWTPRLGSGSGDGGASWHGYMGDDAPAWIVQSSGTTGRPKFMRLSAELFHRRVHAVMTEFDQGSRMASLFAPGSRPFLIRAAAGLLAGSAIVDSHDVDFLQARNVDLVTGAPRLLRDWLQGRRITPRMLRVQSSGAKLSDEDIQQLLGSFERVEDVYGSSETIKAHVNVSRLVSGEVVTVGQTAANSRVEILREDGSHCEQGEIGAVRIRNDYMADGYFEDAVASGRSFGDGWFHPGDLAAWGPNGRMEVSSRSNDVINLGGAKVSLGEVDGSLSATPGILRAAAFRHPVPGLQDFLAAVVQLDEPTNLRLQPSEIVARAHSDCAIRLGPDATPRDILVVTEIPLTGDGMPRRSECQEMFLRAATAPAATLRDRTLAR